MPKLSLLVKPASGDCNLACEYCFYINTPDKLYPGNKVHRMDLKVLDKLMKDYVGYVGREVNICWQGGEPTLMGVDFFRKVVEYEVKYAKPGTVIGNSLQTNGTLINDDWARFLNEYKFLIGLSIDGPERIFNRYRKNRAGTGMFEKAFHAAEIFNRHSVEYNILCVINDYNADKAIDLYRFYKKNNFKYLQFIPCMEVNKSKGNLHKYSLTVDSYRRFLLEMFFMWITRGKYASTGDKAVKKPECLIRMFDEALMVYAGYSPPTCRFNNTCGEYIMVEYNGDVFPCDFFGDEYWRIGNIMEKPISVLLKEKRFKEFLNLKYEVVMRCEGCKWRWLCNGGCPLHWIDTAGMPSKQNYYCEAYREFFEQADPFFKKLLKIVPENRKQIHID